MPLPTSTSTDAPQTDSSGEKRLASCSIPSLSVVIPCRDAEQTIGAQLEALAAQIWSEPWEVIVSDNGSTDETKRVVLRYSDRLPGLRLVDSSDKRGPAHARNVGAWAARAPALAFCDADDEVAPGWVAAIGGALSRYDFVACKMDIRTLNKHLDKHWIKHPQTHRLQRLSYFPYLAHAGGWGIGVKRALHEAAGGFDESLPIYSEDTDYCLRIQLMGTPLVFVKEAVVRYRYRGLGGLTFRQARNFAEHNVLLYAKYRGDARVSSPWNKYLLLWLGVLRHLARVRDRQHLYYLIPLVGWQVGMLVGSLKYKTTPVPQSSHIS
jgi:glycosyltransferase involved in cell wall biosynthesis